MKVARPGVVDRSQSRSRSIRGTVSSSSVLAHLRRYSLLRPVRSLRRRDGSFDCLEDSSPLEMKPLVVVGSANADFVLQVDRLPAPGETVSASELDLFPGGKGANQAAAASRLGHETHFIGQCGKDANGDFLRKALEESGVQLVGGLKTVGVWHGVGVHLFAALGRELDRDLGRGEPERVEPGRRRRECHSGSGSRVAPEGDPGSRER